MADQAHDNKKWSARDFERYHAGEMSARERHALEKAALDDPFLADALEGYVLTQTPLQDIKELESRLQEKQKKRRLAWYKTSAVTLFTKIAAVVVLILGLTWLLRINMPADRPKQIANVKVVEPTTPNQHQDSVTRILVDTIQNRTAVITYDEIPKKTVSPSSSKAAPVTTKKDDAISDLIIVARQKDYPDTFAGITDLATAKTESDAVDKIDLFSREKVAQAPTRFSKAIEGKVSGVVIRNQNPIRGRVVDNAGNPVAFANINDRQNNTILSADKEGYFSLSNKQNAPIIKVDVNAVGFETNNIALNANTNENKIVLKESNQALSEVVVVGYGAKKRSQMAGASTTVKNAVEKNSEKFSFSNIVPLAGWNHFNQFINDSLLNNPAYFDNKAFKAKTLRFAFELDSSGAPKNIRLQSAAGDSTAAAGRDILESLPPMKKIKNDKKAGVIIRF